MLENFFLLTIVKITEVIVSTSHEMHADKAYFAVNALLSGILLAYAIYTMYKERPTESSAAEHFTSKFLSIVFLGVVLVTFIQLVMGVNWLHIEGGPDLIQYGPLYTVMLVLFFGIIIISAVLNGVIVAIRMLITKELSLEGREKVQFSILVAVAVALFQGMFFPHGVSAAVNRAVIEVRENIAFIEKSRLERAQTVSGVISDKTTCLECDKTDASIMFIGKAAVSSPAKKENMYLIRVNDTLVNLEQKKWDSLSVGDHVEIKYDGNVVLSVKKEERDR